MRREKQVKQAPKPTAKRPAYRRESSCRGRGGAPLLATWMHNLVNRSTMHGIRTHVHTHVEIQYIRQGFGWYFIDGKACPFRPHTLIVIHPNEPHNLVIRQQMLLRKCCLMFMPTFFKAETHTLHPLTQLPRPLQLTSKDSARVELLMQQLAYEYNEDLHERIEMLRALLRALCVTLARAAAASRQTSGATIPQSPLVDQLMDYLELHFRREVTGAELQERFGYSADYLSRILRRHTGCGFKHFITERRIAEARRLLHVHPNMKISAIAETVGFHSFTLFNRIFKRVVGVTAQAYRTK
jgi:AraC-like DNA-binding protein